MKTSDSVKSANADPNLPKFDAEPIRSVLGEAMPKLFLSKRGRLRLVHALSYKFGDNFRNFEGPQSALEHFDSEYGTLKQYLHLKGHIRG